MGMSVLHRHLLCLKQHCRVLHIKISQRSRTHLTFLWSARILQGWRTVEHISLCTWWGVWWCTHRKVHQTKRIQYDAMACCGNLHPSIHMDVILTYLSLLHFSSFHIYMRNARSRGSYNKDPQSTEQRKIKYKTLIWIQEELECRFLFKLVCRGWTWGWVLH